MTVRVWVFAFLMVFAVPSACADEIYLKNGDRLSGQIISEGADVALEEGKILLQHEALGLVSVSKASVERIVRDAEVVVADAASEDTEVKASPWDRELSLGYNLNHGNTIDEALTGKVFANRKTDHDHWTLKTEGYYSETNRAMTAQRYDGLGRYAFSFGPRLAWYNFYKLELKHDRFANVDWRVTPSTGLGYWLSDEPEWKAMAEVGIGWERTNFRDATADRTDAVLVPRAFASKTLFGKAELSEDLTLWPTLSDLGNYRLRSEMALTNPLTEDLAVRLTFIDEYQSNPAAATKKNDARLISSLVYTF